MGYIRAEDILPPEVLLLVQSYIDGKLLYIPRKQVARNEWGSVSGSKAYYKSRNAMICSEFGDGVSIRDLMMKYCLSEKSIQRILRSGSTQTGDEEKKHEP